MPVKLPQNDSWGQKYSNRARVLVGASFRQKSLKIGSILSNVSTLKVKESTHKKDRSRPLYFPVHLIPKHHRIKNSNKLEFDPFFSKARILRHGSTNSISLQGKKKKRLKNGPQNSIYPKKCKQFPMAYAFVELIQFAFYWLGIHPGRME